MKKMKDNANEATWWDHHELLFWLWATKLNAEKYLESSKLEQDTLRAMFNDEMTNWDAYKVRNTSLKQHTTLAAHHFVTSMGVLIRVLQRSQHLFPAIQPYYSKANHLISEGKDIRDMIEHAYGKNGYLSGGGNKKNEFIREQAGAVADAISTIIRDDGHWLGNRLCVEKIIIEVDAIYEVAQRLTIPTS